MTDILQSSGATHL